MQEPKLRTLKHSVEAKSEVVEAIVESIVSKYSLDLEVEIDKIKALLDNTDILTIEEIEIMVMRIPVFMYYAASGIESLGVESDLAKAVKLEVYSQKYASLLEGTIKDREAYAAQESLNEALIEIAFSRAYKKLKTKLDMAEHIFTAAKKVLSKRMQDVDLYKMDRSD